MRELRQHPAAGIAADLTEIAAARGKAESRRRDDRLVGIAWHLSDRREAPFGDRTASVQISLSGAPARRHIHKVVVPGKAGTQGQATEACNPGFRLSPE